MCGFKDSISVVSDHFSKSNFEIIVDGRLLFDFQERERERERAGRKRKKKRRNVFTENARKRGRERYKRLGIKKDSERESYANR